MKRPCFLPLSFLLASALALLQGCDAPPGPEPSRTEPRTAEDECRAVMDRWFLAVKDSDRESFLENLWTAQRGDGDKFFEAATKGLADVVRIEHTAVENTSEARYRRRDPGVRAAFNVRFKLVRKGGEQDGTSFPVVRTENAFYVVFVN